MLFCQNTNFDRIWGFDSDTTISVVEVYVSKIRKKLKGTTFGENLQTLRSVGYILKMPKRIGKLVYTDKFSFFIRYFAVFTLIFGLMTAIIFQLMRSTMYQNSDNTLKRIKEEPAMAVGFAIARTYEPNSVFILQDSPTSEETTSSSSDSMPVPKEQKILEMEIS